MPVALCGRAMPDVLVREPIYQQLNQVLRDLASREFKAGDQFLTEREVATLWAVSARA